MNAVVPGYVDTPLLRMSSDADEVAKLTRRTPIGRLATADGVADAVTFLLSPAAAYMTGAELVVDGGFTAEPGR